MEWTGTTWSTLVRQSASQAPSVASGWLFYSWAELLPTRWDAAQFPALLIKPIRSLKFTWLRLIGGALCKLCEYLTAMLYAWHEYNIMLNVRCNWEKKVPSWILTREALTVMVWLSRIVFSSPGLPSTCPNLTAVPFLQLRKRNRSYLTRIYWAPAMSRQFCRSRKCSTNKRETSLVSGAV